MIKIREEYRYFTHLGGKESVIPLSKALVKAYPSRIKVSAGKLEVAIDLKMDGEVEGFTHLLNIAKARVEVFGKAKSYFHLFLFAENGQIFIELQRGLLDVVIDGKEWRLARKERVALMNAETIKRPESMETISFGCAKKPLLEKNIDRESKLYSLSQLIPQVTALPLEISQILPLFQDLFAPKNRDYGYKNLNLPEIGGDVFSLFSTFREKMKERLYKEEGGIVYFLPGGKDLGHAGRALGIKGGDFSFDILWKKGKGVKLVIDPHSDGSKIFSLGKKYRVKNHPNERGGWRNSSEEIFLKVGRKVYIDRIDY